MKVKLTDQLTDGKVPEMQKIPGNANLRHLKVPANLLKVIFKRFPQSASSFVFPPREASNTSTCALFSLYLATLFLKTQNHNDLSCTEMKICVYLFLFVCLFVLSRPLGSHSNLISAPPDHLGRVNNENSK